MTFAAHSGKPGMVPQATVEKGMPTLVEILERQVAARRREALARARASRTIDRLAAEGIKAKLIGSLARGTFKAHSDVDFLILTCPVTRKYTIESLVEDMMAPLPFSVVYLDEVDPTRRSDLLSEAGAAMAGFRRDMQQFMTSLEEGPAGPTNVPQGESG